MKVIARNLASLLIAALFTAAGPLMFLLGWLTSVFVFAAVAWWIAFGLALLPVAAVAAACLPWVWRQGWR